MKSTYCYPSSYRTRLGSKIASKRLLRQWPPRRQRLQNIEQIVGRLVARVTSLETNAASGSSGPDSARSSNVLGQSNGSTATGPSGPMALGRPMTIGTQDVDLILLQALKTNMHGVPSYCDSHVSNKHWKYELDQ